MVVVIGGGVIGLGVAWELARAGQAVTVVERGEAGRAASWAAAGMLAPRLEAEPGEQQLLPLLLAAHELWPGYVAALEAASGQAVDYRAEGTLAVARDRDELERLRFQQRLLRQLGVEVEWLTADRARELEPHLGRSIVAAMRSPLDHQVDNRLLVRALRIACVQAGALLLEQTPALELLCAGGRVEGVLLPSGILRAQTVVLAAGCWSRGLPGLPEQARPPVRPVKGQMLAVQMSASEPLLRHVVWAPDVYLVPRRDGRLLIGASVEEQGFDLQVTAGAMMDLLRGAWRTLPGIYELPLAECWAGLRPGSRDDAPILGPTPVHGLVLATGHYRNGILLAPLTARAIGELLLRGALPSLCAPFTLARFEERAVSEPGVAPDTSSLSATKEE